MPSVYRRLNVSPEPRSSRYGMRDGIRRTQRGGWVSMRNHNNQRQNHWGAVIYVTSSSILLAHSSLPREREREMQDVSHFQSVGFFWFGLSIWVRAGSHIRTRFLQVGGRRKNRGGYCMHGNCILHLTKPTYLDLPFINSSAYTRHA